MASTIDQLIESIDYRICIEPRDNVRSRKAVKKAPTFNTEMIDFVLKEIREDLIQRSEKRRGYVVFSYGPFIENKD